MDHFKKQYLTLGPRLIFMFSHFYFKVHLIFNFVILLPQVPDAGIRDRSPHLL